MIDTIALKKKLANKETRDQHYLLINNGLRKMNKTKMLHLRKQGSPHYNLYETTAFYDFGILSLGIEECVTTEGYYKYYLKAVFKPALVIYPNNLFSVCEAKDYNKAYMLFNNFIDALNDTCETDIFPYITGWNVNRVDYCFQFFTKNYAEYFCVLRKGDYSKYLVTFHDSSIYAVGSHVTLNFYDKTVQMAEKGYIDADNVLHCIRFEFQCNNRYLRSKKALEGKERQLKDFWNSSLAYRLIWSKWLEVIGSGDFYSVPAAVGLLSDTGVRKKRISELKCLLEYSCRPDSVRCKIEKGFTQKHPEFDKKYVKECLIRSINHLGINVIALPESWRIDMLLNPVRGIPLPTFMG